MEGVDKMSHGLLRRESPTKLMDEAMVRGRREVNMLIKSALTRDNMTDDLLEPVDVCGLPPVSHGRKRGKGVSYDRARSSEWKKSFFQDYSANKIGDFLLSSAGLDTKPVSQQAKDISRHKMFISSIFAGQTLPTDRALKEKEFLAKIKELEKEFKKRLKMEKEFEEEYGKKKGGSDRHAILQKISSIRETMDALCDGLEPYKRNAYWVYLHTRKKVSKVREKFLRSVGGKKDRKMRKALFSEKERCIWKESKEGLRAHNLKKKYERENQEPEEDESTLFWGNV